MTKNMTLITNTQVAFICDFKFWLSPIIQRVINHINTTSPHVQYLVAILALFFFLLQAIYNIE